MFDQSRVRGGEREAAEEALPSGPEQSAHAMLALQRAAGNRATAALVQRTALAERLPSLARSDWDFSARSVS